MKKTALYPYHPGLLPFLRHFTKLQEDYSMEAIYSLAGSCLAGKDASYACNFPESGMIVKGDLDENSPDWEILIFVKPPDMDEILERYLIKKIKKVLATGKGVRYCTESFEPPSNAINLLEYKYNSRFSVLKEKPFTAKSLDGNARYRAIDVPIVLIGGLVESCHTSEVAYTLAGEFKRNGISALLFSRHGHSQFFGARSFQPILNSPISEAQKILEMNHFCVGMARQETPDLILVEAPDAVMKFNEIDPNGFGIRTYMLTQAIGIDFFVCAVPQDLAVAPLLDLLSQDFALRLAAKIDAVQVTNLIVDSADMLQRHKLSVVHHYPHKVSQAIRQAKQSQQAGTIPVFDVVEEGALRLIEAIREKIPLPMREEVVQWK